MVDIRRKVCKLRGISQYKRLSIDDSQQWLRDGVVQEGLVDGQQFDALAKAFTASGSRRRALGGLLGGAFTLTGWISGRDVEAHDLLKKCRDLPRGDRRRECVRRGKAHKREHEGGGTCEGGAVFATYWATANPRTARARCENWPINYNWGGGSPFPGIIPNDDFSAEWLGKATFAEGYYYFTAQGDDGIRVWLGSVNPELIIDRWIGALPPTTVRRYMSSGTYDIKVEFRELGGDAIVFFDWDRAGT